MRGILLIIVQLILRQILYSQELVLNGDFEDCGCPDKNDWYSSLENCKNVDALNSKTPDYYSTCTDGVYNAEFNPLGSQAPHSGKGFAGFILLNSKDRFIEYLKFDFFKPLEEKEYLLTFYLSWAECSDIKIDAIGYLFSKKMSIKFKNDLIKAGTGCIGIQHEYLDDKTSWVMFQAVYEARGGEVNLILGNFANTLKNLRIEHVSVDKKVCFVGSNMAYYYIDDVSVIPLDEIDKLDFTHY